VKLHDLKPAPGSQKRRIRVGRGIAAGRGKTAGRGTKGTGARKNVPAWFEGGQMPLYRRVPKRGFKPINRREYQVVNVGMLAEAEGSEFGPEELKARGLISSLRKPVKILGVGAAGRAVTVRAHAFSASARQKIEADGGTVELIG